MSNCFSINMPKVKNLECPVSNCDEVFYKHCTLRDHIFYSHNIKIQEENFKFEDESAFLDWKQEIEDRGNSTYIQETGTRPLKNGSLRRYYICHRSLKSKSKLDDSTRKRAMKAVGSNKIGKACPSKIIMTVDNYVHIRYFSTHIGHDCELGRQPIGEVVRTEIAAKLAEGVPVEKILDEVREQTEPHVIRRVNLIQRKDLHNIKRDFNLLSDSKSYRPEVKFIELDTKLECGSSQSFGASMDTSDDEEDCKIEVMLRSMLELLEKSVLDKYNREILRMLLRQGLDVLRENLPKPDKSDSVSHIVGTQNCIPQKRRPLSRTACKNMNSDIT